MLKTASSFRKFVYFIKLPLGSTYFQRLWGTVLREYSAGHETGERQIDSAASLTSTAERLGTPKILGHHIVTEECLNSIVGDRAYHELPVLHILAKRNNIFATLTDCNGRVLSKSSCGAEGFRNAQKKTTVASQTLGISIGLKAQKLGISSVRVKMRGLGPNRLSTLSGASLAGLQLVSLTDDTNVHYGHGRRPRKPPRK
ncbi:hypothetical protein EG68_12206 [Paragonimus skrjabini miyazakii]|uniref:Ribosomal protein S11 n=1 Tax=Paragonimus skrjabini miyazakii TaxID=59628 RepID=A0A8S9YM25_9TREM|nr:hypothetical protein EG68_12206 [Paragonimus skrjabini miyazakii]